LFRKGTSEKKLAKVGLAPTASSKISDTSPAFNVDLGSKCDLYFRRFGRIFGDLGEFSAKKIARLENQGYGNFFSWVKEQ
jgi:hypothetical protein